MKNVFDLSIINLKRISFEHSLDVLDNLSEYINSPSKENNEKVIKFSIPLLGQAYKATPFSLYSEDELVMHIPLKWEEFESSSLEGDRLVLVTTYKTFRDALLKSASPINSFWWERSISSTIKMNHLHIEVV